MAAAGNSLPNETMSIIGRVAVLLGSEENALRLLFSLLLGYPLGLCHRYLFYGRSANIQHVFFTICGLSLCYYNFGYHVVHSVVNILLIYMVLIATAGTRLSVVLAFLVNMMYLCVGYYITMIESYTIKWTTPHCVLTLRLIGLVCDVYDGRLKPEQQTEEQKQTAITRTPTLLEICGHSYFFGGFLVGPQFPLKRYLDFVSGTYTNRVDGVLPDSVRPAFMRLLAGGSYILVYQLGYLLVPDSIFSSDNFHSRSLLVKCLIITLWGKLTLYKYVACWLIAEGVSIMTGLTYNGKDEKGNELWDSCANIRIRNYEKASTCQELILAFNINTNRWMAKYVFKRLKFLGNKEVSQCITLFFLALWHGLYSGYFMNFGFEFFIVMFEKQSSPFLQSLRAVQWLQSKFAGRVFIWCAKKLYAQFVLAYALISFCLFTFERYSAVYNSVFWIGHVLFVITWPTVYLMLPKSRQRTRAVQSTTNTHKHDHEN